MNKRLSTATLFKYYTCQNLWDHDMPDLVVSATKEILQKKRIIELLYYLQQTKPNDHSKKDDMIILQAKGSGVKKKKT